MIRHTFRFRPLVEGLEHRLLPATFTVTDLGDNQVGSGLQGDLRYCLTQANANTDASNLIVFAGGLTGTITLTQGPLAVTKNLEIDGPGETLLTISGNHKSGVFYLTDAPGLQQVQIADLTVADGTGILDPFTQTVYEGGGLFNDHAAVNLTRVTFSGNQLSGINASGGAIYNGLGSMVLDSCTISGNDAGSDPGATAGGIFNAANQAAVTLHDSTVSGNTARYVSAIQSQGILTLDHSTVADNDSEILISDTHAAIQSLVKLTITASTIADNIGGYPSIFAAGGVATITDSTITDNMGGGISNYGSMTISGTTVSGNVDTNNYAGGIFAFDIGTGSDLNISNSTISGNTSTATGGIRLFSKQESLELTSCTITGNSGFYGGLSVFQNINTGDAARAVVRNSIIARNQGGYPDVQGPVISIGYNLIGQTDGSTGWGVTDLTGNSQFPLDPQLSPLQDNGGPTLTHAPAGNSPAHQHGDPSLFGSLDQRGSPRGDLIKPPDIGAVNMNPAVHFSVLAPDQVKQGEPFTVTVIARDSWGNTAFDYTGTIHFTSSDAAAQLPANYAFQPADWGVQYFTATLNTVGSQTIKVTGKQGFPSGTVTVDVQSGSSPTVPDGSVAAADLIEGDPTVFTWTGLKHKHLRV